MNPSILGLDFEILLDTAAQHGDLTLNADGSFFYDPDDTFVGTDTFTYRAFDGVAYSNVATVTIEVTNDAPWAYNDEWYFTMPDTAITLDVLNNDVDTNGDTLSVAEIVTGPANGTASINSDGTIHYTPASGFNGFDSLTYRASDGLEESNTATVSIMVGMPLTLDLPPLEDSTAASLTMDQLTPILREAARRWRLIGADVSDLTGVEVARSGDRPQQAGDRPQQADVQYHIVDLPGSWGGASLPGHIYFDHNAAGYGWFVDASPRDDAEFQRIVAAIELQAVGASAAVGLVDLTTAALHEIGHLLDVPHAPAALFPHHVMNETLGLSTRRVLDNVTRRDDPHVPQRGTSDQFEVNSLLASRARAHRDANFTTALDSLLAADDFIDELFNGPWVELARTIHSA